MSGGGRPKHSNFEQRVIWLKSHTDLIGLPRNAIVTAMKKDGLFARTTYVYDCLIKREFLAAGWPKYYYEELPFED
jgi:hypothetical protein